MFTALSSIKYVTQVLMLLQGKTEVTFNIFTSFHTRYHFTLQMDYSVNPNSVNFSPFILVCDQISLFWFYISQELLIKLYAYENYPVRLILFYPGQT